MEKPQRKRKEEAGMRREWGHGAEREGERKKGKKGGERETKEGGVDV